MKTAKEILKNKIVWTVYDEYDEHAPIDCYEIKDTIEAMEEYRNEACHKRDELIKAQDELITFLDVNRMLLSPSLWAECIKLSDKIEQLRNGVG